jgi:hypothetical protein
MDRAEYKVSLAKIARTLLYEDRAGSIRFTFDLDTSGGQKIIILERTERVLPPRDQARYDLAFGRAKDYLFSLGYQVEVFPEG